MHHACSMMAHGCTTSMHIYPSQCEVGKAKPTLPRVQFRAFQNSSHLHRLNARLSPTRIPLHHPKEPHRPASLSVLPASHRLFNRYFASLGRPKSLLRGRFPLLPAMSLATVESFVEGAPPGEVSTATSFSARPFPRSRAWARGETQG